MNVKINPKTLNGKINIMPSKSHGHRLLIASYLAGSTINMPCFSEDIKRTKDSLLALDKDEPLCPCGESGSTLRFLLPIAMVLKNKCTFLTEGRLLQRPLSPLREEMEKNNCKFSFFDNRLIVENKLKGGDFYIPGDISSQFITGLLFALPLTEDGGNIFITSKLESSGYVDLTLQVLESFGISITKTAFGLFIKGNQKYSNTTVPSLEGDWSNGAFFIVANALGSNIDCMGLNPSSAQPDKAIENISLPGIVDVSEYPDLLPILAVKAAFTPGLTKLTGAKRLRLKESDRIAAIYDCISTLGGNIKIDGDDLLINGGVLNGGTVSGHNDHRIVMAATIAATRCLNSVTILGANAVNKSYPDFFEDFKKLGGDFVEI